MFTGTCQKVILAQNECRFAEIGRYYAINYKLSYRKDTALQGELVVAKSGRPYSADSIGLSSTTVT